MCTENFHFSLLLSFSKKEKKKKEKSDKLWQVSGGLIAHLPPQNTLPAKWPPKPPFWLNIDCLGEKVLRLRLVVVVESTPQLEQAAWRGEVGEGCEVGGEAGLGW